jgi:Tol biopolymer transport system component
LAPVEASLLNARHGRCLAAVALGLAALAVGSTPAEAAFPGVPGPIGYSKLKLNEGGNAGGLRTHGPRRVEAPRTLTNDPDDTNPSYSANGRRIVFESNRDAGGSSHIYVMNATGSGIPALTSGPDFDSNPSFSANGRQVAFDRTAPGSRRSQVFVVNVDGSGLRQLTRGASDNEDPTFTPDGRRIVFVSDRERDARSDRADIFSMSPSGTGVRQLVDGPMSDSEPDVAPDGRRLAFVSNRAGGPNVFVAKMNGRGLRQLTHSRRSCFSGACYRHPSWSPGGKHIALVAIGRYNSDLHVVRVDGSRSVEFAGAGTEVEGFGTRIAAPGWGPAPRGGAAASAARSKTVAGRR